MSLLDHGTQTVTVFPEIITTTRDGNTVRKASEHGTIVKRAVVQPIAAPTDEQSSGAQLGTGKYRLRLPRSFTESLGAQSVIEWRGDRYSIVGDPIVYSGSARTRHTDYTIERR